MFIGFMLNSDCLTEKRFTRTHMETFIAEQNIHPSAIIPSSHKFYYIFYETESQLGIYVLKGVEKGRYVFSHSWTEDPGKVFIGGVEDHSFGMVVLDDHLLNQAAGQDNFH